MKLFNQKQLAIALLSLLAAPFVIFSLLMVLAGERLAFPAPPVIALHSYGVLCVSFFAGIQWGVHFCKRTEDSVYLLSFMTLATAWLSLLAPGQATGLSALLLAFVLSWWEECRFSTQRVTTLWFWRLRCVSTIVIILSLIMTIAVLASRR